MVVLNWDTGLQVLHARDMMPGSNQASVFGVGIAFSIIGILVMGLRVHSRVNIIGCGLGLDDHLMLVGTVVAIGLSVANMICAWYGVGVHVEFIRPEYMLPLLKANYATRLLYVFALFFVKISILVFYTRIDHRRWTRWTIYFLMFTVVGLSIATACILAFECWPPSLFWTLASADPERCMSPGQRQIFYEANGIINIVQDIGIWLIPIPILWGLQVPRRQKLGVMLLFCVGIVALIAGCIRYYYVLKLKDEKDSFYYLADSLNWCSIEIYAAIICGSASTFRALLKKYVPRLLGSSARYGTGGMNGHPYNQSSTGDFALKPYGNQLSRDRAGGEPDSQADMFSARPGSQRGILEGGKKGIMMSKEITVKVTDAEASSQSQVAPFSQV